METGVHCVVTGKVQMVRYRLSTQEKAQTLNLEGWVKNLPSGQVELIARGALEDVQRLVDWLSFGPPMAKVEKVDVDPVNTLEAFDGFKIIK